MAADRVLVVEDDKDIRANLIDILGDHGYEAVGASNGKEALDQLRRLDPRPCVIVLDLMMPVMDGRSFRHEQLLDPELSHIPVIVISAYADIDYDVRELEAQGYLRKPLRLKELLRLVDQHRASSH